MPWTMLLYPGVTYGETARLALVSTVYRRIRRSHAASEHKDAQAQRSRRYTSQLSSVDMRTPRYRGVLNSIWICILSNSACSYS